jgi:OmpA-OmpF porin, OOP family
LLKAQFTNAETDKKLTGSVNITVSNNLTGEVCNTYISDSLTHKFAVLLPPGKNNNISYKKNDCVPFSENIDLSVKNNLYERRDPVTLTSVTQGSQVFLNNIFFETGKVSLSPSSNVALKDLETFLKCNPDLIVELSSTIVAKQDIKLNSRIAQERAEILKNCLCNAGLSKEKIIAKGTAMKIKKSPDKKAGEWFAITIVEKQLSKDLSSGQSTQK